VSKKDPSTNADPNAPSGGNDIDGDGNGSPDGQDQPPPIRGGGGQPRR
jgi:hypothetical protein